MARTISYILGAVMVLAGIVAFAMSGSVFGVFMAGTALSVVWIVAGVITLAVALWTPAQSVMWAKIAGIVLVILAVLGLVMSGPVLGYLDNTMADNVLHLVLAVLFLWVGFMPGERRAMPMSAPPSQPAM